MGVPGLFRHFHHSRQRAGFPGRQRSAAAAGGFFFQFFHFPREQQLIPIIDFKRQDVAQRACHVLQVQTVIDIRCPGVLDSKILLR